MTKNCDILLINAIVLTMDEDFNQYEPGAVAIQNDSILEVGPEAYLRGEYESKEIIDCGGKVQ